jgi:membrane protein implicated in regulation of membrane protease activity
VTLVAAILLALFVVPSPWGLLLVAGAAVVEVGEALFWIRRSRRRPAQAGAEALVGATAVVVSDCVPDGQVRVAAVDGLTVVVQRL